MAFDDYFLNSTGKGLHEFIISSPFVDCKSLFEFVLFHFASWIRSYNPPHNLLSMAVSSFAKEFI